MRFDIYGRFQLEVVRVRDAWAVYRLAPGQRVPVTDFVIPAEVEPGEVATFLDDLFHETAVQGATVRRVA